MRVRRILTAVLVIALAAPFCGVELLYRWGLARVGELPRLSPQPHVGRLQRALWTAEEGGPMEVQPLWPWTIVRAYAGVMETPRHAVTPPGGQLASSVARLWLAPRRLRMLERHWQRWSLSIWLSRNATAEQLTDEASQHLFFGRGAFGADAAARTYFGLEPDQLTWTRAAFLAGLVQSPTSQTTRRTRWVLDQLLASGAITPAEHAESLQQLPALTPP